MAAPTLNVLRGPVEVPIDALRDRRVAILGYGNQGRAHALNLQDSGINVVVGSGRDACDDFPTHDLATAASMGDLVILAVPDEIQGSVFADTVADALAPGATLGFISGFSVHFGHVQPPEGTGMVLVAPKGPGTAVRARFVEGSGVPALLAVHQENTAGTARDLALAWAAALGAGRSGVIETTFGDEAETDLFGEQAVIVGGLATLVRASYETLIEAGYPPHLAYIECCHEVKQVADILHERGMAGMMEAISTTAECGAYVAMDALDTPQLRTTLAGLLAAVRDGSFATYLSEHGSTRIEQCRVELATHDLEAVGEGIRSLMVPPADT